MRVCFVMIGVLLPGAWNNEIEVAALRHGAAISFKSVL